MKLSSFVGFLFFYLLLVTTSYGQYLYSDGEKMHTSLDISSNSRNSAEDYIRVYQRHLSGLRGNACPMFPSCSNYTLQVINNHGIIPGVIKGADRLLRCGHEQYLYKTTLQENGMKLLDLVDDTKSSEYIFRPSKSYFPFNQYYSDTSLNFIGELIKSSLFSEALLEINRNKIQGNFFTSEMLAYEMLCFNAMGKYEKSIFTFEVYSDSAKYLNTNVAKQLLTSYYSLQNYRKVLETQKLFSSKYSIIDWNIQTCLNLSFLSLLNLGEINKAKEFIMENPYLKNENSLNAISKFESLKFKSPTAASIFSFLVPGLGYFYSGSKATGVSALIFNALVGYATYSSFKSKNYGVGALSGLLGLGFYIGNIQGSKKSAVRFNQYQKSKIFTRFEKDSKVFY
jgi:putative component of membrane protein insertase Oxa1/YidC/SpoIIIJ protein YidD